jgi:hypothetical protein
MSHYLPHPPQANAVEQCPFSVGCSPLPPPLRSANERFRWPPGAVLVDSSGATLHGGPLNDERERGSRAPPTAADRRAAVVGDVIGCLWNPEAATMTFSRNGAVVKQADNVAKGSYAVVHLAVPNCALLANFGARPFAYPRGEGSGANPSAATGRSLFESSLRPLSASEPTKSVLLNGRRPTSVGDSPNHLPRPHAPQLLDPGRSAPAPAACVSPRRLLWFRPCTSLLHFAFVRSLQPLLALPGWKPGVWMAMWAVSFWAKN